MNNIKKSAAFILILLGATLGVHNLTDTIPRNPDGTEFKVRSLDREFYITLHHTATKGQSLKQIAKGHIKRGFPGPGYFAAINWQGEMYQLNEIDRISWHDSGENTNSIGIVFVGNYEERELPDDAVEAAEKLIEFLEKHLTIIGVRYHGQTSATLCPGKYAIDKIQYLLY